MKITGDVAAQLNPPAGLPVLAVPIFGESCTSPAPDQWVQLQSQPSWCRYRRPAPAPGGPTTARPGRSPRARRRRDHAGRAGTSPRRRNAGQGRRSRRCRDPVLAVPVLSRKGPAVLVTGAGFPGPPLHAPPLVRRDRAQRRTRYPRSAGRSRQVCRIRAARSSLAQLDETPSTRACWNPARSAPPTAEPSRNSRHSASSAELRPEPFRGPSLLVGKLAAMSRLIAHGQVDRAGGARSSISVAIASLIVDSVHRACPVGPARQTAAR